VYGSYLSYFFDFQNITAERVEKSINTINIKKATDADNIPAKVVRQCKVTVAQQLSSLINLSINTGVFPDSLKVAQVTPIHKQNDPLNKYTYRPVLAQLLSTLLTLICCFLFDK
jgi:hypothetical protein